MEKNNIGNTPGMLNLILWYLLVISLSSCKKDHETDIKTPPDLVFSGKYSNTYDKWKLIAIENGFRKKEEAKNFDYLKFSQPSIYEIVKNEISIEKGTISKDTAYSTDDLLIATFVPEVASAPKYINPGYRYFVLKNDTLILLSTLDTVYSYRFVRLAKWVPKSAEGFHMNTGNSIILAQNDIDYYDASAHLIYLKTDRPLIKSISGGLVSVYVDTTLIYPLVIFPMITSSYSRSGANIMSWPTIYPNNLIFIDYTNYSGMTDKRNDNRIIDVLKKNGKYHEGLSYVIQSVQVTTDNKVKLDFTISNNDTFDYYYLDPVKTGLKLFHYFTAGLILTDSQNNIFMQRGGSIQPSPWNTWDKGWLSLIRTGEKTNISIIYEQFDAIPPGPYQATFRFPGLIYQVKKSDLQQADGRIWLGEMTATKDVTIQ